MGKALDDLLNYFRGRQREEKSKKGAPAPEARSKEMQSPAAKAKTTAKKTAKK